MGQTSRVELDESALISQAAQGEAAAIGRLYDQYVQPLFCHVFCLVNDSHLAERLTAQAFSNTFEALRCFRTSDGPFLISLLRMTYELTANLDTVHRHNDLHRQPWPTPEAKETAFSVEQSGGANAGSEQSLEGLLSLPADQRHVLVMRFIDGLNESDVARVIGKSVSAVRLIQLEGLSALQRVQENGYRPA